MTFLEGYALTEPDIDPHRLVVAAHELGHALTWHALGFLVDTIWIKGHGDSAHGEVMIDITKVKPWTYDHERDFHVGLLGGREAHQRWCDETGMPFLERHCAEDMAQLRRRRSELGGQTTPRAIRTSARQLVRSHWRRVVLLAPVLARRGSLNRSHL